MIHNIEYLGKNTSKKKFITDWAFKQGVFKTPQGKFIVRIKNNKGYFSTISSHNTEDEATLKYNKLTTK